LYNAENDTVTELADGGIDEVLLSVTNETGNSNAEFDLRSGYNLPANVENLTLSAIGFASSYFVVNGNDLANVITGAPDDDVISGGGGADTLIGGAGDDQFVGGGGFVGDGAADTMQGGSGNDRYRVSDLGDVVIELAGEGTDEVVLSSARDAYIVPDNVENLTVLNPGSGVVQPDSRTLTGNALDNKILVSGGRVKDTIDGGAGADTMEGGFEDDIYIVDNAGDLVVESSGKVGGVDEVRTALSSYQLPASVEKLTYTGTASASLRGNDGVNELSGGDADDIFYLQDGGNDTVSGGGGDDGFYFGAALTGADKVDGGAGALDQIGLQGDYSGGVTIGGPNITGVEQLVFLPGNDTRFGDTGTNFYDYDLTWSGGLALGQRLVLTANTLRAGEDFTFDGSAEANGAFLTYGGLGVDTITGGQKDDSFFFGIGRFGASDKVDGQGGFDQLGLQGDYTGDNRVIFGDDQLVSIEQIVLLSGGDARFGNNGLGYAYDITTIDANVAAGATLVITANTLRSDEFLEFDGRAETDGRFRVFGGQGTDVVFGGAGNDEIFGGLSADVLVGGDGGDLFLYTAVAESTSIGFDRIVGFDYRTDKIDLPRAVGHFSDAVSGTLSTATFDENLAAALNGVLGAYEAAAFQATSGDMAGRLFGIVDANGVAGYQAGEDYVVEFVAPVVIPTDPTIDFLI
jgi:Ca2+-binding RTX toxin-like protein